MFTISLALSLIAATQTTATATATPAPTVEALQPCDFGKRHPEAPKELDQFAFLIGNWEIRGRAWDQEASDWTSGYLPSYWEGRWILDGRAIADYWYDTPPKLDGPAPGRGVNVRMYRPETKQWTNMWQHSRLAEVRTLISEVRDDGRMHLWSSNPDTSDQRHMTFIVESDDHWYRLEERSNDGGKTWFPAIRLDAHRAPCPLTL